MALRFDLSSITDTVRNASLKLRVKSNLSNGTGICTLFTISSQCTISQCSWVNASAGNPWKTMGGDFSRNQYVTAVAADTGAFEVYDVTALVNGFIRKSTPNYGFLLEPATSADLVVQMQDHNYYSSETADTSSRPALVLNAEGAGVRGSPSTGYASTHIQISRKGNIIRITSGGGVCSVALFGLDGRCGMRLTGRNAYVLDTDRLKRGMVLIRVRDRDGERVLIK